jgi:hypothetical protein
VHAGSNTVPIILHRCLADAHDSIETGAAAGFRFKDTGHRTPQGIPVGPLLYTAPRMLGIKHLLKAMHASLTRVDTKRIYLFSLVIGAVTGVGAVAFYWCFTAAVHLTYEVIARIPVTHPGGGEPLIGGWTAEMIGEPRRWVFLIMPAIGGLFAGWIVHRFAPEAAGTGTEGFIDAFHNKAGSCGAGSRS